MSVSVLATTYVHAPRYVVIVADFFAYTCYCKNSIHYITYIYLCIHVHPLFTLPCVGLSSMR